jgi:MFS family permease
VMDEERVVRAPVVEVFKRQPKEIFLAAFTRTGQMVPAFVYAAFFFTYGTQVAHVGRDFLLMVMLIASFFSFFTIPLSGYLSDRFGRKPVYFFGAVTTGLFAFAYYALLDTSVPALILLATLIAYFFHDLMWGSQAALIAECFTPRLRYSGASIGFQLAAVFAGGPAPLIATAILAALVRVRRSPPISSSARSSAFSRRRRCSTRPSATSPGITCRAGRERARRRVPSAGISALRGTPPLVDARPTDTFAPKAGIAGGVAGTLVRLGAGYYD